MVPGHSRAEQAPTKLVLPLPGWCACSAKSHPLSNRTSRFWDPIHDTSTPLITPGPTTYCPSSLLTLGIDSM